MTANVSQLRFHVGDLLRRPGDRRPVELDARLGDLAVSASRVPEDAVAQLALQLDAVPDGLVVSGTVSVPWTGTCRRCLREVAGRLEVPLREIFERHPVEGETWPLEGDQIDVAPVVRENVLLELPQAPLCGEDCQGLCPECGVDRNDVACGHTVEPADPRWAALDSLRFER